MNEKIEELITDQENWIECLNQSLNELKSFSNGVL